MTKDLTEPTRYFINTVDWPAFIFTSAGYYIYIKTGELVPCSPWFHSRTKQYVPNTYLRLVGMLPAT